MKANPAVVKVLSILAVIGLLMLGLGRIGNLVDERRLRSREAEQGIALNQAGRQALMGPVLHSRCVEEWETTVGEGKDKRQATERREFLLSAVPRQLTVLAQAVMEPRYRGLFKVNTYVAHTTLRAEFAPLVGLRAQREHAGSRMACGAPVVMVAVSDARGIRQAGIKLGDQTLAVTAGTGHPFHPRGFHAVLSEALRGAESLPPIEVSLELVGSAAWALAPVAEDSRVEFSANWPHPSFGGRFLPLTRTVGPDGFRANWQLSALSTTAPLDFARNARLCEPSIVEGADDTDAELQRAIAGQDKSAAGTCIEAFSVAFIDPVNPYSLSDRAIKYALLFIGLSFVGVGMVEVLRRLRVHPMQYLLVGCALSIFFLLLLSLSEHLSFGLSYALAAGACCALLTFYARHLLAGWRPGLLFGSAVAGLYGALYLLLQMEQRALVIGSVLLFAVLAAVMVLTRKLDWYGLLRASAVRE